MTTPLVFHPIYSQLDLPERHRFPIEKYVGIRDELVRRGVDKARFITPSPVDLSFLTAYYDSNYVNALTTGALDKKAMRRIGFPWSQQLIERTRTAVAGTCLTATLALEQGKALNLTGGYHHAFADFGSGFCLFNDLYLAAKTMQQTPSIDNVLIIDLDVHQGDGTAKLAEDDRDIFTLSIHGEKNFPYRKQLSDIDIGLAKGAEDDEYLGTLEEALTLASRQFQPDAIIYDAGVDVHVNDDLGHLHISTQGVYERDKKVFALADRLGVPIAAVIGGGYQRDIAALVDVHIQLYRAAGVID
ncbi:histone deacetylase [Alteromonas sp. BL110]|uniref:histone deacetylase family protein n=1 Tax=Alteromonas sp. BL110 TaxID=1714845 RepID=UPI000E473413|nr:histone deacetylase [Alteromonas sp. BL110]AXT39716.1 histone deacetylase [Alteromonas sp. BL110]RKM81797.1 histone deacetylase [Alteromonas sp. BL110]